MPITTLLLSAVSRMPQGSSAEYVRLFGAKYLIQYIANRVDHHLKEHLPMIENRIIWLSTKVDLNKLITQYENEYNTLNLPIISKKEALSLLDAFIDCCIQEVIELAIYGKE